MDEASRGDIDQVGGKRPKRAANRNEARNLDVAQPEASEQIQAPPQVLKAQRKLSFKNLPDVEPMEPAHVEPVPKPAAPAGTNRGAPAFVPSDDVSSLNLNPTQLRARDRAIRAEAAFVKSQADAAREKSNAPDLNVGGPLQMPAPSEPAEVLPFVSNPSAPVAPKPKKARSEKQPVVNGDGSITLPAKRKKKVLKVVPAAVQAKKPRKRVSRQPDSSGEASEAEGAATNPVIVDGRPLPNPSRADGRSRKPAPEGGEIPRVSTSWFFNSESESEDELSTDTSEEMARLGAKHIKGKPGRKIKVKASRKAINELSDPEGYTSVSSTSSRETSPPAPAGRSGRARSSSSSDAAPPTPRKLRSALKPVQGSARGSSAPPQETPPKPPPQGAQSSQRSLKKIHTNRLPTDPADAAKFVPCLEGGWCSNHCAAPKVGDHFNKAMGSIRSNKSSFPSANFLECPSCHKEPHKFAFNSRSNRVVVRASPECQMSDIDALYNHDQRWSQQSIFQRDSKADTCLTPAQMAMLSGAHKRASAPPAAVQPGIEHFLCAHRVIGNVGACLPRAVSEACKRAAIMEGREFRDFSRHHIDLHHENLRHLAVQHIISHEHDIFPNLGEMAPAQVVALDYVRLQNPVHDPDWNAAYLEKFPEGKELQRGQMVANFREYVGAMSGPHAYMDEMALCMLSDLLQTRIIVLESRNPGRKELGNVVFCSADFRPTKRERPHLHASDPSADKHIFLIKEGLHFDWAHIHTEACNHPDCVANRRMANGSESYIVCPVLDSPFVPAYDNPELEAQQSERDKATAISRRHKLQDQLHKHNAKNRSLLRAEQRTHRHLDSQPTTGDVAREAHHARRREHVISTLTDEYSLNPSDAEEATAPTSSYRNWMIWLKWQDCCIPASMP